MKMLDVVTQLQLLMPKYTVLLTDVTGISTIVASGGTATITTSSAHGLSTGQAAVLANIETETPITAVSKSGNLYTFTTSPAHDLTYGWTEHETITLSGFTDGAWNAAFELKGVPNRNQFVIQSTNSLPSLNSNEVLHEIRSDGVNGRHSITVSTTTVFTVTGSFLDANYTGGTVNTNPRIAGAVTVERALEEYTKKPVTDLWLIVAMHDADISKDRHSMSDAAASRGHGDDIRTRMLDGFTIYAFVNTTGDIAGQDAVDLCRHTLLQPILRSVYGAIFDTGLAASGDFKAVLTGHGLANYDRAVLVYSYSFETAVELTTGDSVQPGDTRAFRDIDYTEAIGGADTTNMTVEINLDEDA